ncbi:hypothetical protein DH2020_037546 [Rehmannia glutinosa]|uniref:DUS-like FMN-binding domain-containing protein n=1 Tax=Rehmannia glutinosa TaxID=99300 RepID=A0ABR0V3S1_REHGL
MDFDQNLEDMDDDYGLKVLESPITPKPRVLHCLKKTPILFLMRNDGCGNFFSHHENLFGDGSNRRHIRLPMRFKPLLSTSLFTKHHLNPRRSNQNSGPSLFLFNPFMATQTLPLSSQTLSTNGDDTNDESLCSSEVTTSLFEPETAPLGHPNGYLTGEARIERAWAHWNKLGRPKLVVAPMVDNSELPFRLLCRKYGAQAAYTPMLHARIFSESEKYRSEEFTTYTINYAKMLEEAGCALLAVHGRTRDEKDGKKIRANWKIIKAVRDAVRIPVLANGNIRHVEDAWQCIEETGVEGVLSAETLLENPALFAGYRTAEWVLGHEEICKDGNLDQAELLVEYLQFCEKYPVPWRMIRSHVHKLLGEWFRVHPDVREDLNAQNKLTFEFLYGIVDRLRGLGGRIPLFVKDSSRCELSANGTFG